MSEAKANRHERRRKQRELGEQQKKQGNKYPPTYTLPNRKSDLKTADDEKSSIQQEMTTPQLLENLQALFPELTDMPHQDTLCRLLEKIDVEEIENVYLDMLRKLNRKKKFQNLLHQKRYLVAVDGTQKYVMEECWDRRYLRRKIRGKEEEYHYYAYVMEAVMIFSNGMVLPLMSIFLENSAELETIENDESWKQDCELKAFHRLVKRLKQEFPKLPTLGRTVRQRAGHRSLPQKQVEIYDRAKRQIASLGLGRSSRADAFG